MDHKITVRTKSERETEAVGEALAARLGGGVLVAIYGELGAGKTVFTRGIARGLGISAHISSPTFTIVNEYKGKRELLHFDMYRIGSADELFDIGWEDYQDRGAVSVIEWSENVSGIFDGNETRVLIERLSDNERQITISGGGLED